MKRLPFPWLVVAFIITVIFGTIYGSVQQVLRQGANDPQLQMAEETSDLINKGASLTEFNLSTKLDAATTLEPFIIIYDKSGKEMASTVELDGKTPELPRGVLDHAKPQHQLTWQPKDNVRIATVVQATNNGYVLAGRSLREVEKREDQMMLLSASGWGVSEVALVAAFMLKRSIVKKSE